MRRPVSNLRKPATTTYEDWMRSEGIPVVEAVGGVEDVKALDRKPWARTGGKGTFIYLEGMKGGVTGMYVMEIRPGKALEPEKHMYEELIYILTGQGATEIWHEGQDKRTFEWGEGSLFSPPLNTWHRLYNGGREPVLFLGVTNAPIVMDLFHNTDFVFGDTFIFRDRYSGEEDYFKVREKIDRGSKVHKVWDTNFIPDLKVAAEMLDDPLEGVKGARVKIMNFEMSENVLSGHLSEWPVGMYHKAHYHGAGAILLGLRSKGYVLLWPKELGTTPYRNGVADKVIRVNWGEGAVYSPGDGWFHQHFNTGKEPARHIAFRTGGTKYRVSLRDAGARDDATVTDIKKGGALIEHEDEDPAVHAQFEGALAQAGVRCAMGAYHPLCSQK
jgi:mannose-6-phosphate isomerase-like protein (cupin superfamily)